MSKYNIYEFQQFFKSKQDLSKDYLIEKYFKNNKEIENLQSQLQAHKAKEKELRDKILCWGEAIQPLLQKELLDILDKE